MVILKFLPTFQNKDEYYERLMAGGRTGNNILVLYAAVMACAFIYGVVMGAYHSPVQAIVAGVKVAALLTIALAICFPAFYIIQYILGSRLALQQMLVIIFSGFLLMMVIMVSLIPVVVFFLLTGSNYYFLQLLHIAIFAFAGFFGMKTVIDALKYSCEKKNIYPQIGVTVFKFWVVILAFVSIQLAWNLRPFLGDRGEGFKLFRRYKGNFYTALIYSFRQLAGPDRPEPKPNFSREPVPMLKDKGKCPDGK